MSVGCAEGWYARSVQAAFGHDLRLLICPGCGAPIQGSPEGGTLQCRFCGSVSQVGVRNDAVGAVLGAPGMPLPESERLARLRAQAGKALMQPASLAPLFDGGRIAPWRMQEALATWQGARRELAATGSTEAGEVLYHLTLRLGDAFFRQKELERARAVLESGLDALRLPRHRQGVRCVLARFACQLGDVAAAEQWLRPCDPASDDIEMDSPYRRTLALVATLRRGWAEVLRLVGTGDEVPLMVNDAPACTVLRANALEQLGQIEAAAATLARVIDQGPAAAEAIRIAIEDWRALGLCPQSMPLAQRGRDALVGRAAAERASGGTGVATTFLVLGSLQLSGGIALGVWALTQESLAALAITGAILTGVGVLFLTIGWSSRKAAARARRIAVSGVRTQAQIVSIASTGTAIQGVPQLAFSLLVELPGRPPYPATTEAVISPQALTNAGVGPGTKVYVRVDSEDASAVVIEWT